jgi:hypothetical protein
VCRYRAVQAKLHDVQGRCGGGGRSGASFEYWLPGPNARGAGFGSNFRFLTQYLAEAYGRGGAFAFTGRMNGEGAGGVVIDG